MLKKSMQDLQRKTKEEFHRAEKFPIVVVLDNIRSMHNVGSVFRTADAFLVESVCLCGFTPVPPHRDIQKTALGATETVCWEYFADVLEATSRLQEQGYGIYAVEQAQGSLPLQKTAPEPGEKIALVFGNEVNGVDQRVVSTCDGCIEIPQLGMKHSLNISVAAGIVLWELVRDRF